MKDVTPTVVKSEDPYDAETVVHTDDASPTSIQTTGASLPVLTPITNLHASDVILSTSDRFRSHHDASIKKHAGNVAYGKLVDLNRELVARSNLDVNEKLRVAQSIVTTIKAMGGRFLECKDESEPKTLADVIWVEVRDFEASEITCKELNLVDSNTAEAAPTQLPIELAEDDSMENSKTSSAEKKDVDPNMLINLSPDQTVNLNFPVGSKVLYNINFKSDYSDAQMGIVKSVSMDLGTRDMLYTIEDKSCNDSQEYFMEEELAFAPNSSVTIEVSIGEGEQKFEGEVLSCCFGSEEKVKLYSVMVHLDQKNIRVFHGVRQKRIRHRNVVKAQLQDASDELQGQQAINKDTTDKVDENDVFSQPVLPDVSKSQKECLRLLPTDNFEVKEVQVPKPKSQPQQDKLLYNISDGSTIPSTNEMPISQDSKSEADESSSVPSSESSSELESLFGESTTDECEKFTTNRTGIDESVEADLQSHTPNKTDRVDNDDSKGKFSSGNRKKRWDKLPQSELLDNDESNGNNGNNRKNRWTKQARSDSNVKHRSLNDGSLRHQTKRNSANAHSYNCDNTLHASGAKQQKRRSASVGSRRCLYNHNHTEENNETNNLSATKPNRDKKHERKRWTPPHHGGISAKHLIASRGSHIRFDAPTNSTKEDKRRRRH